MQAGQILIDHHERVGNPVEYPRRDEEELHFDPDRRENGVLGAREEEEFSAISEHESVELSHVPDGEADADMQNMEADDQDEISPDSPYLVHTRETFFLQLRSLLLNNDPDATTVATFFKTSSWWYGPENFRNLVASEKSLMSEAFHLMLRDALLSTAAVAMTPYKLVKAYMRRRLLNQEAWAHALVTASTAANDRLSKSPTGTLDQKALAVFEAHRTIHSLAILWAQFFEVHQHDILQRLSWEKLLPNHPAKDYSSSLDYAARFFAFAPRWQRKENGLTDQLVISSSLLTLEAVAFWINQAASLVPSAATDNIDDAPASPHQSKSWSRLAPELLSPKELCLLFVVSCAADSTSVNAILLRLALAKMSLPAERAQAFARTLQELQRARKDDVAGPEPMLTNVMQRQRTHPLAGGMHRSASWVLLAIRRTRSTEVLREWQKFHQTLLSKQSGPSASLTLIARALCQRFWDCGATSLALHVWKHHGPLHRSMRLFEQAVVYYVHRRDVAQLEKAWQLCARLMGGIAQSLWQKRLNLLYEKQRYADFDSACLDMIARTGCNRALGYDITKGLHRTVEYKIGMFNYNIKKYLQAGIRHRAGYLFQLISDQDGVEPTESTIRTFTWDAFRRADASDFRKWVMIGRSLGFGALIDDCTTSLILDLQCWPCSATWAGRSTIMDAISRALSLRFGDRNVICHADGTSRDQPANLDSFAAHLQDEAVLHLQNFSAFDSKAYTSSGSHKWRSSIRTAYMSSLEAVVKEIPSPRNVRLVCFLHEHYTALSVASGPADYAEDLRRFSAMCTNFLDTLPWKTKLSLLNGDLYKPVQAQQGAYENFALVDTSFGMHFFAQELTAMKISGISSRLLKMPWKGFAALNDQALLGAGITSRYKRLVIIRLTEKLHLEAMEFLQRILKIETNGTRGPTYEEGGQPS